MSKHRTGDVASILIPLVLLVSLGAVHAPAVIPEGYDDPANDFSPFNFGAGTNAYDFMDQTGIGTGTFECDAIYAGGTDHDGDGDTPYHYVSNPTWADVDKSCIILQDWDQDGTCDHRVHLVDRAQGMPDFAVDDGRYEEVPPGSGNFIPGPPNPSTCTGWSPA